MSKVLHSKVRQRLTVVGRRFIVDLAKAFRELFGLKQLQICDEQSGRRNGRRGP